jgi:hypothetical protein
MEILINNSSFSLMTDEQIVELAHLYFKKYSENERQEIRLDFQIHATKKMAKNWATALSHEPPELYYLVREDFFRFFAHRQQISL